MASTRVLRVIAPAAAGCLIAIVAITPSLAAEQESPQRPQLPRDFRGVGRYIVPDLNGNVPFTWQGKDGDSQMTAGGPKDRIWFENLIYRGTLYTITYEWPGLKEEEKAKCVAFGGLDRDWLNGTLLKTSRYVGKEVLQGTPNRHVNHWRAGLVFLQDIQPDPGQPLFPRIPAMVADIYVSQVDPTKWWKVLQFGVQNALDPALDEWFEMDTFSRKAGEVTLPRKCRKVQPTAQTLERILRDLLRSLLGAQRSRAWPLGPTPGRRGSAPPGTATKAVHRAREAVVSGR